MLMADYVSHRLVKSVIARICAVRGTGDNLVPYFAETVSEIREPITVIEKDVEAEQKRQINLKVKFSSVCPFYVIIIILLCCTFYI